MKKAPKIALLIFGIVLLMGMTALVTAIALNWHSVGMSYRDIPKVVSSLAWGVTHPVSVAKECDLNSVGPTCCDKSDSLFNCASTPISTDYCNKYLYTCRVQADGHCGFDVDQVARQQKCINDKEYPE